MTPDAILNRRPESLEKPVSVILWGERETFHRPEARL